MGCTRQSMHHVAIQRSDILWARFMAAISKYDLATLIWLDDKECKRCHTIRKYDYSIRPLYDHHLLVSPVISREGVHDVRAP